MKSLAMFDLAPLLIAVALTAGLVGAAPIATQAHETDLANPTVVVAPQAGGWTSGFSGSEMVSPVYALAVGPNSTLYAGGMYSVYGGEVRSVMRWDGKAWIPLGSGIDGSVAALAVGPDGSIYAGGGFTTAGGVSASCVARWDGATWHALGSGMDGRVSALVVGPDGSIYAGGGFTTAGGVPANRIARWDGATWRALGSGIQSASGSTWVSALAFGPDGSLYVGGEFSITTTGGAKAYNVARWDGTTSSWRAVGSGMNDPVEALAFGADGSLYAGGQFTRAGGVDANRIARWDGMKWHPLGSGMSGGFSNSDVAAVAMGPDGSLYAGGNFTIAGGVTANHIARWNGASWSALGSGVEPCSGSDDCVGTLVVAGSSLYAGGAFTTAGGVATRYIARWDGANWHRLGGKGTDGMVGALAVGPDGLLYAGGSFTTAGGLTVNRIARWDGSAWHPLDSGMSGGDETRVSAFAVGPDGSVYAGGNFTTAGGAPVNNIARWDGTAWHPLSSGLGGSYDVVLALVLGSDGALYAGGNFGIARWDGTAWHPLGGGTNNTVDALAVGPDGSLYAGGGFTTAGEVTAYRIARWDGTTWYPVGSGLQGIYPDYSSVRALAFGPDGALYAGGDFTTAGDVLTNGIARWDGTAWHPLSSGMSGGAEGTRLLALAVSPNGSLYAGGKFTTAGGIAANYIARWDGAAWHPLANGMSGMPYPAVWAMAFVPNGSLYAGGAFTTAGGIPSSYLAAGRVK